MNKKEIALKTIVSLGFVGITIACVYIVGDKIGSAVGNVIVKIWKK